jgi:ADP-heptose:LPS heptosyltransferase
MALFYHSGALGDFLLSLPFLRALRRACGAKSWALAVAEEHAALVQKVFPNERRHSPGSLDFAPLFERSLDPSRTAGLLRSFGGFFGFLRRGEEIEAVARAHCPECPVVLVEPFASAVPRGKSIEDVLSGALSRLEAGRAGPASEEFALSVEELPALPAGADPLEFLGSRKRERVALLHHGASDPAKKAPLDLYAEVARGLEARGFTVGWVRGFVEAERGEEPSFGPLLDSPSLVELAHAISRADLYLGNDTGPTHLASALGVPTISIHGRPNPAWRPRGPRACVVGGEDGFPSAEAIWTTAMIRAE